jgi:hypothetical protein
MERFEIERLVAVHKNRYAANNGDKAYKKSEITPKCRNNFSAPETMLLCSPWSTVL